jgi:hypothetical protein
MLPQANANFDLCLVELADFEANRTKELLDAIAGQLIEPGTILVHWHDQGRVSLQSIHHQIVQFALDRACQANAQYAGSWASAYAARALYRMMNPPMWRRLVPLALLPALAVLAEFRERARKNQVSTIPKYCSSATFHIEIPSQTSVALVKAPTGAEVERCASTKVEPRTNETEAPVQSIGIRRSS